MKFIRKKIIYKWHEFYFTFNPKGWNIEFMSLFSYIFFNFVIYINVEFKMTFSIFNKLF